jgi:glycosyltransferase involved in cell wall biosynthesis
MFNIIRSALRKLVNPVEAASPVEAAAVVPGDCLAVTRDTAWVQRLNTMPFDIDRIAILFATYQRSNTCQIDIRLFDEKHGLLHSETIGGEVLFDNAYYGLKLPKEFSYKGICYLTISSPDATPENCVALWTAEELGANGLRQVPRRVVEPRELTSVTQDGLVHVGVTLAITCGHNSNAHARRSYMSPHVAVGGTYDGTAKEVVLVGFSDEEQQLLASLNEPLPYQLRVVEDLNQIPACRALLVPASYGAVQGRSIAKLLRARRVPLIVAELAPFNTAPRQREGWRAFCDGLVSHRGAPLTRLPHGDLGNGLSTAVEAVFETYRARLQPKISIVTILSGKADQLKWVIQSYFKQTYSGEVEVIYINDCFGAEAEAVVAAEFERCGSQPHHPKISYSILRNEQNLGNCESRNRGVAAATGDLIIIIDADCMLNADFITAHAEAHAYLDCEVVIGPYNIETNGVPPLEMMVELAQNASLVMESADLQDSLFLEGFLNCITRNFSIKKDAISENLFDLEFSYSLAPNSGFGWEDVEMGYRLYKRGLSIKFTEDAYSVHISHGSSVPESAKPKMSIRNFRKLFKKHPEMRNVARRWAVRTLDALNEWSKRVDPEHNANEDLAELRAMFVDAPRLALLPGAHDRKLRILTYRWHVPHQYELYKTGHEFFLVKGTGTSMCDRWEYGHRPMPANARFIDLGDVRDSDFDLALLHFDENVLNYENTNGQIGPEWGAAFRHFVEHLNLPKVAICHGTPQFHGQYTPGYDKPDLMTVIEPARAALVDYVKDIEIVCNSNQAQREWGFHKSRVIWHGFDPSEFLPATYSKGILSPLGPLVKSRPHYRGFYLYQQVFSPEFPEIFLPETLSVPDPDIDYVENVFAIAKYKNYIDQIRQYSVYFNPTLRSPMPRARCEPMMCGVVTVNANNHDVDMFIKNGVNGFYSNDPDELREQLLYLMRNPGATRKMGAEARKTAIDVFNHDRYLADWAALLKSVV